MRALTLIIQFLLIAILGAGVGYAVLGPAGAVLGVGLCFFVLGSD